MRPILSLSVAALAGTLFLGCGEQPVPSEPAASPLTLRAAQNTRALSAQVFRHNELFFRVVDFEWGLTTVLGATPEEHVVACQSGIPPEEASWKEVILPSGVSMLQVKAQRWK